MTTQEHSQAGPDKIHRKAEKPNNHQTPDLDLTKIPVSTLKGVGSEKTALLAKLKIETITDLLLHRPKRYEDRTCLSQIKDLALDEHASVHGEIITCGVKYRRGRSMSVFEAVVEDASGRLRCRWWNMPSLKEIYTKGHRIFVSCIQQSILRSYRHVGCKSADMQFMRYIRNGTATSSAAPSTTI